MSGSLRRHESVTECVCARVLVHLEGTFGLTVCYSVRSDLSYDLGSRLHVRTRTNAAFFH